MVVLFQPFAEILSTQKPRSRTISAESHYFDRSFFPLMMARYGSFSSSMTVFLLLVGIVLFTADNVQSRDFDCRRFVFAPICRGATIKRSFVPNDRVNEDDVHGLLINHLNQQIMEAESRPFLIPLLIDQRLVGVPSPRDSHQTQLYAED